MATSSPPHPVADLQQIPAMFGDEVPLLDQLVLDQLHQVRPFDGVFDLGSVDT
ncbi:hypothetical protein [Thiorhodovibrio frisius]|uniref:hypothetical protein n=1 Tax=Thiorhodovibrio frisius TaxID=631362 RepID=UPI0002EFBF22|nr:hypothetical protein [Thiorhodovibrio frisius]